jgi:hypothetical protein
VNNRRSNCSICGSQLSAEKIQGQQYSPREIENHFCESCIPYWSILHSKVVGEDMSFLAEEQGHVVDRPVLGQGQAQIPYQPVRPALTNDRPKTVDELLERGGTHKGKPVKVLRLNKNDQGTWE